MKKESVIYQESDQLNVKNSFLNHEIQVEQECRANSMMKEAALKELQLVIEQNVKNQGNSVAGMMNSLPNQ